MGLARDVDIEIVVYAGLGVEAEEQFQEALKAAKLLEDLGFVVTVVPVTVEWDFVSLDVMPPAQPAVQVNGVVVAEGRVAQAHEIVASALAALPAGAREPPAAPIRGRGDGGGEVSVSVAS